MTQRFDPTARTRLHRKAHRASYDADVVFGILDAGIIAHVGYVADGLPVCTPTAYWREGEQVYWHGAAAGRALQAQTSGPVSFTVSHVDGFVLGRSGFTHSLLYRSVMAFGRPEAVSDAAEKRRAMDAFVDRLYPGRSRELRPPHDGEIAAITVLRLALDEVSAKVREPGVLDREADMAAPCWAGVVPVAPILGPPVPDPRMAPGTPLPASLAHYQEGARLEDALRANLSGAGGPPGVSAGRSARAPAGSE